MCEVDLNTDELLIRLSESEAVAILSYLDDDYQYREKEVEHLKLFLDDKDRVLPCQKYLVKNRELVEMLMEKLDGEY